MTSRHTCPNVTLCLYMFLLVLTMASAMGKDIRNVSSITKVVNWDKASSTKTWARFRLPATQPHYLIIDANYQNTIMMVYTWPNAEAMVQELPFIQASPPQPTIHNYRHLQCKQLIHDVLQPLIRFGEACISHKSTSAHVKAATPLSLKATVAFRLLPDHHQDDLMNCMEDWLNDCPFNFLSADVLDTHDQGILGSSYHHPHHPKQEERARPS